MPFDDSMESNGSVRTRKMNPTKFPDTFREALIKKMDKQGEKIEFRNINFEIKIISDLSIIDKFAEYSLFNTK